MKKQTFLALVVLLFFAFSGASFAYTQIGGSKTAASGCCKGDSCPMKKKEPSGKVGTSCDDSCCKKDSKAAAGEKSCCKCCGAKEGR